MLLDPNRWPKPHDLLGSPRLFALASLVFLAAVIALIVVPTALAEWAA